MGRKTPKRKFRAYLRGAITHDIALATLAAKTLLAETNSDVLTEKAWLSSVKLRWALSNWTPVASAGPILVGVAHGDYSDAEIEAWVENQGSWEQGDLIAQEIGRRRIRQVGTFESPEAATGFTHLNGGKPIHTKCGWQLTTGQSIRFWAYNTGTASLSTTSPVVTCDGHANLWPN